MLDEALALFSSFLCVDLLQSLLEFGRKLVKASLATWLEVNVIELGLLVHFSVTECTGKVMNTPGFVESSENVSCYDLIAHKAQIAKELMVMSFTVSKTLLLVVSMAKEGFLTLRAHKVLNMPMFAQSLDNALFDRTMTCTADGNSHLIMARKTV